MYLAILFLLWLAVAISFAIFSGPDDKLANVLTVLCFGVYRFYAVPQGYNRVLTLFGKVEKVSGPGLHSCWSFWNLYHVPRDMVPIMEQVQEYGREIVFTKDGVECDIDTVVFFTIHDVLKAIFQVATFKEKPRTAEEHAEYKGGIGYRGAIKNLVQAILRNECGNLAARELLASRKKLAEQIKDQLAVDAAPWGINIRLVEIKGIDLKPRTVTGVRNA